MPSRLLRRALPALLVPAVILGVTACAPADPDASPAPSSSAGAVACVDSGNASDAVTVSGDFGSEPTVDFTPGLEISSSERTVVIEGDGEAAVDGDVPIVHFSFYNAATGEIAGATPYDESGETPFIVGDPQVIAGISDILRCTPAGSRVVGAIDVNGAPGIFVVDILRLAPLQAQGEEQDAPADFPTTTFAKDGEPTVEIPDVDPPTDLQIATLIAGDGALVQDGAQVVVQYQGVNWTSGEVFDGSWMRNAPSSFVTTGVIEGFGAALVGQAVGSRVQVIIPPDKGYGEAGSSGAGIAGTDTLVFTVDILAAASAQ